MNFIEWTKVPYVKTTSFIGICQIVSQPACFRFPDKKLVSLSFCSEFCPVLDFHRTFCVYRTWRGIGQASKRTFSACALCSSRPRTTVAMKIMPVPERSKFFEGGRMGLEKLGSLMNLRSYLWLGLQIPWPSIVTFIANSVDVTCRCWLTCHLKFCGNTEAQNNLQWTTACVWRRLFEWCAITAEIQWPRKKLSVTEPRLWRHHLCGVTESILLVRIWSLMKLLW